MKITGHYRAIVLLAGIIVACTVIAEAGKVDFTPSDDVMPMGYEGITSFNAASPQSSMSNPTVYGAPSSTHQTWNMPTAMPMGRPMESQITIDTTNEDGILSADITIDSDLDGPIGGSGKTTFSPEFDTHDFSGSLKGDSEGEASLRNIDLEKMKDYDVGKELTASEPGSTDEAKSLNMPAMPEKNEPIYSHDISTDSYGRPGEFDSNSYGQWELPGNKTFDKTFESADGVNNIPNQVVDFTPEYFPTKEDLRKNTPTSREDAYRPVPNDSVPSLMEIEETQRSQLPVYEDYQSPGASIQAGDTEELEKYKDFNSEELEQGNQELFQDYMQDYMQEKGNI